jgi:hypothetical protein
LGQAHSLTPALHQLTTRIVLTVYNIYSPMPEAVVGKGHTRQDPSQIRGRLTNAYHATRPDQSHQELPAQGPYHALPTGETKPKTKCSCMWNPLPNLTGSCARDANQLGVFGLVRGPLTNAYHVTVLAVCHYNIVLPIITGRGVKYTHNDHRNPTVPTHSGGPGLGLVHPGRHPSLEVIR